MKIKGWEARSRKAKGNDLSSPFVIFAYLRVKQKNRGVATSEKNN